MVGRVDGWTGGRVDGWTGGRVDGWTGWTGGRDGDGENLNTSMQLNSFSHINSGLQ